MGALFDDFLIWIGFECTVYVGSSSWICVMQEPSARSQNTFYSKLKNLKKSCHIKIVNNIQEDVSEPNTDKKNGGCLSPKQQHAGNYL